MITKPYNLPERLNVFAVDGQGIPTTYLSFEILKTAFSEPHRWFTTKELTTLFATTYYETNTICRQLELADLLTENPMQHGQYRYNLNSQNVDVQVGFEKFLIDVELENLPVHLMMDYSPFPR
jgi:hypothetical protein